MSIKASLLIVVVAASFVGCTTTHPVKASVGKLPDLQFYKVEPYLQAAIELQSLDRPTALARLHTMAQDREQETRVIILCRMLFTQRSRSDFRRPRIGQPSFLGGTDYSDWPTEPIELVEGVPFLITRGYLLSGVAEPDDSYLRYCETNCDWSSFRYTTCTLQQKDAVLSRLIASPKWKRPLDTIEQSHLLGQIFSK